MSRTTTDEGATADEVSRVVTLLHGLDSDATDERAVSQVLGVVLVIAIVLVGVVSVVGFGIAGFSGDTTELSDTAVERDLTGFAAAVEQTTRGDVAAGTTTVDLSTAGLARSNDHVDVDGRSGRLTLSARTNGTERELANTSLGLIEYGNPDSSARIAYQSGLVLSAPDSSATPAVVRANGFAHRTDDGVVSLSLPVTSVTGRERLDRQLRVSVNGTEDLHPNVLVGTGSGTAADELLLRVESTYSEGWELALREVLPDERTDFSRRGDELKMVYHVPDEGMFLHAHRHDVELGGR
jgi:FlaG/FlaF family flagellin (archaellin)